jgi:hypothetical protein
MRVDRLPIIILFLLPLAPAWSQVAQGGRFEISLFDSYVRPYSTLSLGADGILVYGTVVADGVESVQLIRIDTALNEVWKGFIRMEKNSSVLMAQSTHGKVLLLLKDRFNKLADFTLLLIDNSAGTYVTHSIPSAIPFNPTHFLVTGSAALIGGYFNYRPLVLHYSFSTLKSKILPGFFNDTGELNQLTANEDGSINIVVCAKNFDRRKSLWIRNYSAEGDLVKSVVLSPTEDRHLNFGRVVNGPDGKQMVCGVYGRHIEMSRGVFLATISEYGEYEMKYYNYSELHHFFNYLKAKKEARVKERIERRRVKGKKMKFNYRLMVNEVVPYGDQFIMLGEAFYPHYSYPTRSYNPMTYYTRTMGTAMTRGDMVFDGYQFTHAVVVGFDRSGKLQWDNSFEINDVRTFQLNQFVKIAPENDRIVLLYLFENVIRSKIIKEKDILEGKTFDHLQMKFMDDVVRGHDTESSTLEYWYGTTFFASGYQQIRNVNDKRSLVNRRVFFVNKIEYK